MVVNSTYDSNYIFTRGLPYIGTSYNSDNPQLGPQLNCLQGRILTPVAITINDYGITKTENDYHSATGKFLNDQDVRIHTLTHEMGHAIGLEHSQILCSIMWEDTANLQFCGGGVYFPVADDIKAAAMLYGWAGDTGFASNSLFGAASVTGFPISPLDLQINAPSSGAVAKVYNTTALPSSNIAIMTAYVTPSTLYRFNIGWGTSTGAFSALELDNDGAKLVDDEGSNIVNVQNVISTFTPQANISYFLELIVEKFPSGNLRTHAYVYQGSIASSNGAEYFDGHSSDLMVYCNIGACPYAAYWSDANGFNAAVWTDSDTNPSSTYTLNHFWNFQGSAVKSPPRYPSIDSLIPPSNPTYSIETSLAFNAHGYPLSKAVIQWGDGQQDTVAFKDYTVVSGTITVYHSYLVDVCALVARVTVYDVFGQVASRDWGPCVRDFGMGASPTSLSVPQGSTGTSSMTITSIDGFAGTVSLTGASATTGITASFSPAIFYLQAYGSSNPSASISVASSVQAGTYSLIATATSTDGNGHNFSHEVIFTVRVNGFTMATNPSTITLVCTYTSCNQRSATSALTFTSVNGFSGTITLSYIAPNPTGYTVVNGPSSVYLSGGGTATVTVTAYLGSISGVYVWTIRGQNQGFSTTMTLAIDEYNCNRPPARKDPRGNRQSKPRWHPSRRTLSGPRLQAAHQQTSSNPAQVGRLISGTTPTSP